MVLMKIAFNEIADMLLINCAVATGTHLTLEHGVPIE